MNGSRQTASNVFHPAVCELVCTLKTFSNSHSMPSKPIHVVGSAHRSIFHAERVMGCPSQSNFDKIPDKVLCTDFISRSAYKIFFSTTLTIKIQVRPHSVCSHPAIANWLGINYMLKLSAAKYGKILDESRAHTVRAWFGSVEKFQRFEKFFVCAVLSFS